MSKERNKKKKYYPKKEHASRKPRAPKKSLNQKLKELQEHFNDNYHAP